MSRSREIADLVTNAVTAAFNARDERQAASEKAELVKKVVAVNLLNEETASKLDVATLRQLAGNTSVTASADVIAGKPQVASAKSDSGKKETIDNLFDDYHINDVHKVKQPNSESLH